MQNKWPTTKISDMSENLDSKRVPVARLKRKPGDIPYYGATGIVNYVDDYIFDEELLLIGEDGADWSGGANTAFIINGKSWVNNHAHVLRIKDANIQFVMNYLNHSDLRNYISGTTRGKLNQASLNKIKVPNPSLRIQQKIASILSSVDEDIQKTDQIIQKAEKLKQGLMNELLTKGVGHKKFKKTKLGEIPEEWDIKPCIEVSKEIIDCKNRTPKYFADGEYLVVRTPNVRNGKLVLENALYTNKENFAEWTKRGVPQTRDILITREAPSGEVCLVPENIKLCLGQRMMYIRLNDLVIPEYLLYFLQSNRLQDHLKIRSTGSTVSHLKVGQIKSMPIVIPTYDEQRKIAQVLSEIDKKIDEEVSKKTKLELLKRGLMQDIFSQKVEVN